eukprot:803941-Pyramimonas_sp.AAC.3
MCGSGVDGFVGRHECESLSDCDIEVSSLHDWCWDVPVVDVPGEVDVDVAFEFPIIGDEASQASSLPEWCGSVTAVVAPTQE